MPSAPTEGNGALPLLERLLEPFCGTQKSRRSAQKLLRVFGSLDRTLSASEHQLISACGDDRDVGVLIAAARALIEAGLLAAVTRSPVDCDDAALERYLTLKFHGRPIEELHAIFVDRHDGFIAEEIIAAGGPQSVSANLSHVVRRSLELGAAGMILFHNHPSREPNPSADDVRSTQQLSSTIAAVGVKLIDHLIIAGRSVTSMRRMQLL